MNLATVEVVAGVMNHPNADRLDIIKILGYDAIVGRDAYKVGDLVVFIQPDSILPHDQAWCQDLLRYTSRGRLRAVRLRSEWSMGLVVDMDNLWDGWQVINPPAEYSEGDDLTELLGVTKYEPRLPNNLQAKGGLPYQIPKTDEERWQNLRNLESLMGQTVDVTLKMDGSSGTFYCILPGHWPGVEETVVGLTSRSLELKSALDEPEVNSKWHEAERRYNILTVLRDYCEKHGVSLAIRGEVTGAGLQSSPHNPHAVGPTDFHMYSVYNICEKKYERREDQYYYKWVSKQLGVPAVLTLEAGVPLTRALIDKYDHELEQVGGVAYEGVVVQYAGGSFKVINKWYDATKE